MHTYKLLVVSKTSATFSNLDGNLLKDKAGLSRAVAVGQLTPPKWHVALTVKYSASPKISSLSAERCAASLIQIHPGT